jgi:hypothetical protein
VSRVFRSILLFVGPCLFLSACAAGSTLHVPGDLSRPARTIAPAAGAPRAVVEDFSYAASPDGVVGRDYDRVRPIVWKGEPGKAMADLIAGVLGERGIVTVRRRMEDRGSAVAPVRISGVVRRFEVNARRTGGINVTTESTVSVQVKVEGSALSGPSERTVTGTTSLADLFITPDDLHEALLSAANSVAEEAARKLIEGRAFPTSSAPGSGTSQ